MKPVTNANQEHPFAQFVRILGKGKTGTRDLTRAEAREAFGMILRGETEALQLGAFLMLLRVKEESHEEIAGFVDACRDTMVAPTNDIAIDLDWSSYAGKKHQHPWYVLAILLLSGAGHRVLVHGAAGHTPNRLYTEQAMRELGLPLARDWGEVATCLDAESLCYMPLHCFCPVLHDILQLRPLLGLRSPVNTLARLLNPLAAPASVQSIFHPAYAAIHREADRALGQPSSLVFKGDSGEAEIKPHADTRLLYLDTNQAREITLPRSIEQRVKPVETPRTAPLRALWRGEIEDSYGLGAILATTAAVLALLQPGLDMPEATAQAHSLWLARDKNRLS